VQTKCGDRGASSFPTELKGKKGSKSSEGEALFSLIKKGTGSENRRRKGGFWEKEGGNTQSSLLKKDNASLLKHGGGEKSLWENWGGAMPLIADCARRHGSKEGKGFSAGSRMGRKSPRTLGKGGAKRCFLFVQTTPPEKGGGKNVKRTSPRSH